jgi:phospholipase C
LTKKRSIDRRTALKGLGAASLTPLLPVGCVTEPGPEGPTEVTPELLRDRIDTVVLLMMENRSFDHYFGSLSLEEGRTDVDGLVAGMSNPHPTADDVEVFKASEPCVKDPPHGWGSSHDQFNEGANDGFVSEHHQRHGSDEAHRVMGYWDREMLSASYALADRFALCQRWFCSVMSSTWPNRYYSLAATSGGEHGNDVASADFDSIFDRLDGADRTWCDYFSNAPFGVLLPTASLDEHRFKPLEDFFRDAEIGRLPNFSVIEPFYGRNSDHPPEHPLAGQILIASVYEALARSDQWDRCLLVVTYDEHGGWFDHVPPPTVPDDRADDGFDQLGFRVPTLVIGPWVKPGHLSDTWFDHTSVLAFLQTLWGLDPLTERDAAANDMTDLLDEAALLADEPRTPITLPVIEADEDELEAPECLGPNIFRSEGEPFRMHTQPELDAWFDEHLAGTWFDRRWRTQADFRDLLDRAMALGVLDLR